MSDIYHILNRGVDKRKIFLDKQDYFRFIHDLFEFNDNRIIGTTSNYFRISNKNNDLVSRNIGKPRDLLIDIYAFCLMPNHYHLLVSPKIENGISKFLRKLDMGYAKYFNQKHKRKGTLFESRYKSILIEKESHFYNLPFYIHLNPLDIKFPEWRERKLKDYNKAIEFLNNYRWSSHLDYCGKKNFPSVTSREFLLEVFGGEERYKNSIEDWLKDMQLERIRELILE
ncbi:MAG: transposase [Patescibacteria group bacterium]